MKILQLIYKEWKLLSAPTMYPGLYQVLLQWNQLYFLLKNHERKDTKFTTKKLVKILGIQYANSIMMLVFRDNKQINSINFLCLLVSKLLIFILYFFKYTTIIYSITRFIK